MTESREFCPFKSNVTDSNNEKTSDHSQSFEISEEKVRVRNRNLKFDSSSTSSSVTQKNLDPVVPTRICIPDSTESVNYSDSFSAYSSPVKIFKDECIQSSNEHSTKNCNSDGLPNVSSCNTMKKASMSSDVRKNWMIDKPETSLKTTSQNLPNVSNMNQSFAKNPVDSLLAKKSGYDNKHLPSTKSKRMSQNEADEPSDGTQRIQMKTKLRSIWNNIKYGWRIKREANWKTDSALWVLGRCYHNKENDDEVLTQDVADEFRLDLLSRIWLTYRTNFPPLPGTKIVSDSGWGCMLRCGQMMMAQAFVCHYLKRDWRLSSHPTAAENNLYKTIIRWFGDSLSDKSPFSLHHLVLLGETYGRKAGDWYGPTHAAHVLRDALYEAKKHHPLLQNLSMYVASDGIVFKEDIMELCLDSRLEEKAENITTVEGDNSIVLSKTQMTTPNDKVKNSMYGEFLDKDSSINGSAEEPKSFEGACPSYSEFGPPRYSDVKPSWKSLILFVSVRLGNDKINPFYIPCLKSLLAYEHCIGIIGGRPKHALYFIGWQDDKIIHMDPHSCQSAVDVEKEDFNEKSFHSSSVRMMSFSEMDPSCSIGFYFRNLEDFQFFVDKFSEITAPLKKNLEYPVFALTEGRRNEVEADVNDSVNKCADSSFTELRKSSHDDDDDDDDYILL